MYPLHEWNLRREHNLCFARIEKTKQKKSTKRSSIDAFYWCFSLFQFVSSGKYSNKFDWLYIYKKKKNEYEITPPHSSNYQYLTKHKKREKTTTYVNETNHTKWKHFRNTTNLFTLYRYEYFKVKSNLARLTSRLLFIVNPAIQRLM